MYQKEIPPVWSIQRSPRKGPGLSQRRRRGLCRRRRDHSDEGVSRVQCWSLVLACTLRLSSSSHMHLWSGGALSFRRAWDCLVIDYTPRSSSL